MAELYIYYRVPASRLDDALGIVVAAQRRLVEQHPGLVARVLRRGDDAASAGASAAPAEVTLMETYAVVPAPSAPTTSWPSDRADLDRAVEQALAPLAPLLTGARHVEAFVPCV